MSRRRKTLRMPMRQSYETPSSGTASDTESDTETIRNSNLTDFNELSSSDTQTGISAAELYSDTADKSLIRQRNTRLSSIDRIVDNYQISRSMAKRLLKLRDFEIVIVIDDSGSMLTTVDGTQRTRWDELRAIVKVVIEIGVIFDANGVDIYFIHGRTFLKVKDPRIVDEIFRTSPSDYTPMVPVLKHIFQLPLARRGRDKKLLVFVATDGEPTDDNGDSVVDELEHVMREIRQAETTYVSFLLCTEERRLVEYLNNWDRTMPNVDVTPDFETQKAKILQHRGANYSFTLGDYTTKALVGAIDPELDGLDEP